MDPFFTSARDACSALLRAAPNIAGLQTGGAASRPTRACVRRASRGAICAWTYVLTLAFTPAFALTSSQPITYVLDLREPQSHLVQVTMSVPQAPPATEIQFPAWNALYQIRDFVSNVHELRADCDGKPLKLTSVDLVTWRSGTDPCSILAVRYAVYAHEESVFSSVLNEQHAFMNFALLLFYLPRQRERSVRVRFILPQGWRLATLLEEGAPGEFKASNYDALADSPTEAGEFQEYRYSQSGALYRVVVHADPADYASDRLLASLQRVTATETALMRDVPFSCYTFILHFPREGGGGGMEHRNGTAISLPAANLRHHWDRLEAMVAHEFFHLWNVKRIRPQSLEPVDYIHGNDTGDLWFSEGVTSAYQELALLRAGLTTREQFYQRLAEQIQDLQQRSGRHFQSVEEAGRDAWLEKYPDYLRPDRSISYYNKGALLGFLLDLAIRQASGNQHSLDDVMRRLNEDYARRDRFFTRSDLRTLVADAAPAFTELDTFFRDYITGTTELDYERYLGFAGLRLKAETADRAALGFLAVQSFDGPVRVQSVDQNSNAEKAGLRRGDILVKMNGQPLIELVQPSGMMPGHQIEFTVRRGNRVFGLGFTLGVKREIAYRVEEMAHPTAEQLRVRQGWLEGKTASAGGAGG